MPMWSSDGEYLGFASGAFGEADGYRRPADGREQATRLWDRAGANIAIDVDPSDSITVVQQFGVNGGIDLLLARDGADGVEFEDFLTTEWNEGNADISPNGQWIAYQSDESGENRIYVHSFPVITGRRSVSPGTGTDPVWSPDGERLYYRSGSQFLAVDVTMEPAFQVSVPELLFDVAAYGFNPFGDLFRNWDLHPDGSRFVMTRAAVFAGSGGSGSGLALNEVFVVTDWFEELLERMGN